MAGRPPVSRRLKILYWGVFNLDQKSSALKILITARLTQALQLAHNPRGRSHFGSIEIFSSDNYHRTRTHLSLGKDCPDSRPIRPPRIGRVVAIPHVGGLHHRYERLAA